MQNEPSAYERRLMLEVEAIDARMEELKQERAALQRQLMKARWENDSLHDVSRKNSGTRVMVERRILEALEEASKPLGSSKLFEAARRANFELQETTFRTYLHRMKLRGLIENVRRGVWKLPKPNDGD